MKSILSVAIIFLFLTACQSNQSSKPINLANPASHEVVVKEVIQVTEYTYIRVTENGTERWLATPPIKAEKGETYYYEGGFEMRNFKSKELDKTFESILFLEGISTAPLETGSGDVMISPGATTIKDGKKEISITPVEGGITIAALYADRDSYVGKIIKVKGEVTKFSPEIMESNWIHLQDGTESDGFFDLVINSGETVNPGDVVVFEGKIVVDKDLGYGYFFEVLMENASTIK